MPRVEYANWTITNFSSNPFSIENSTQYSFPKKTAPVLDGNTNIITANLPPKSKNYLLFLHNNILYGVFTIPAVKKSKGSISLEVWKPIAFT